MRLLRLSLQGITRFKDRVDLDLAALPPGLIALVGPNGAGKTTLLEALCPAPLYLEFPSRRGPIHSWANRRDAFIELVTEYQGHTWRHLVQADPGTGRSGASVQAFLERDGAPVEGYATPGRAADYEAAVKALFPAQALTLASVFAAWTGRGNFLELSKADRRDLFTAMLGNQRLQDLATRARLRRVPLDQALDRLQDRVRALAEDRGRAAALEARIAALAPTVEARAAEALEARAAVGAASMKAMSAKADLDRVVAERAAIMARRQGLGGRMDRAEHTIRQLTPQVEADARLVEREAAIRESAEILGRLQAERVELGATWRQADSRAKAAAATLDRARKDLEATQRRLQDNARRLAALEDAAKALEALEPSLAALQDAQDARAALGAERAKAQRHAVATETQARQEAAQAPSVEALQARLEALRRAAELLEGVPCGGRSHAAWQVNQMSGAPYTLDCGTCRFLGDARAAKDAIPVVAAELQTAQAKAERVAELQATAMEARGVVGELDHQLEELDRKIAAVKVEADRASELRARLSRRGELEGMHAEDTQRAEEAQRQALECEAELQAATAEAAAARAAGERVATEIARLPFAAAELKELDAATTRLPLNRQAVANARRDFAEAEAERGSIPEPPPMTALAELHTRAERAEAEALAAMERAEGAEREARGQVSHLQGQREALGDLEARAAELEATTGKLDRRRAGFRLVETALGRDGIQALEIDAAGPRVSGLTNALLAASYGGRFTVALRTTRERADGKGVVETFDLEVNDGLRERTGDVADLSKGERVMVDEALKLALACFNSERNGMAMETLFRDESDAGLDVHNLARYPAMLRATLEAGGFKRAFFITQSPEVASQADAVIRIHADGRVTVETP